MSEVIGRLRVRPLYAQVAIECEHVSEVPIPQTGDEQVVATNDALMVATRSDFHGDVQIEVHQGTADGRHGARVFAGELTLSTPFIVVGNTIANRLLSVPIGRAGRIPRALFDLVTALDAARPDLTFLEFGDMPNTPCN